MGYDYIFDGLIDVAYIMSPVVPDEEVEKISKKCPLILFDKVVNKLHTIGYIHEGNLGIKDREAFKYTNKPHLMNHHLYVCPKESQELYRHITFRDFLRNNPEAVKKYSLVKETGSKLYSNDINKYIEYKSNIIQELYKKCGLL